MAAFGLLKYLALALAVITIASIINHPGPGGSQPIRLKFLSWTGLTLWDMCHTAHRWGIVNSLDCSRKTCSVWKSEQTRVTEEYTQIEGVPVVIYYPNDKVDGAVGLVNYHGGGWTIGAADLLAVSNARYADELNAVVVSVEYTLRPEASVDQLYEECFVVTKHFIQNAKTWGVDPKRIALIGESAGANIATSMTLLLRDQGIEPMPRLQVLLTGVFQLLDMKLPSFQQMTRGPIMHSQYLLWLYANYLFGEPEKYIDILASNRHVPPSILKKYHDRLDHSIIPTEHRYPPYKPPEYEEADMEVWMKFKDVILNPLVSPLLAESHENLPEAYIVSSQYDIIRDDSFLYAHQLKKAGVNVTLYNDPLGVHINMHLFHDLIDAEYAMATLIQFMKNRL